jgi:hypothetical protein
MTEAFNLMRRLVNACPLGCQVHVVSDVCPDRLRVVWSFRVGGEPRHWEFWMRGDLDSFDFDEWLVAVEKLMRRGIAAMAPTKPTT